MSDFRLVLGTRNQKKRREMVLLLADRYPIEVLTLDDFPNSVEVDETGTTFQENARLKAVEQAKAIGEWVLGEDSGLSVAALDGAPGVYSARFAGEQGNDEANNNLLLDRLGERPLSERGAWYSSAMALANPSGEIVAESAGECHGRIIRERRGSGGFGYDPLFELPEYGRTFGEMGDAVKSILSHRARAFRKFLPQLLRIAAAESAR